MLNRCADGKKDRNESKKAVAIDSVALFYHTVKGTAAEAVTDRTELRVHLRIRIQERISSSRQRHSAFSKQFADRDISKAAICLAWYQHYQGCQCGLKA